MACPKCGCKVTYPFCSPLEFYEDDEMEKCSNCGNVFWIEEALDEDDDEPSARTVSFIASERREGEPL